MAKIILEIDEDLLEDFSLKASDKLLIGYLSAQKSKLSMAKLSQKLGISLSTIKRSFKELNERNLLYMAIWCQNDTIQKNDELGQNDTNSVKMTPNKEKSQVQNDTKELNLNQKAQNDTVFENFREKKEAKKRDLNNINNKDLLINNINIDPNVIDSEYKNINTTNFLKKQDQKGDNSHNSETTSKIDYTGENFQLAPQNAGEIIPVKPKRKAPKKSEPFKVPSREEFMAYIRDYVETSLVKYPNLMYVDLEAFCDDFFDKHEENGWCLNNGKPIKDWKGAGRYWIRNHMNWAVEGSKPRRELTNLECVEDYKRSMGIAGLPQPPDVEVVEETPEERAERQRKELEELRKKDCW